MNAERYYLRPTAFVCPTTRYWVILDRGADKYLCIHKRHIESLGPQLGWPGITPTQSLSSPHSSVAALASQLVERGILSLGPDGRDFLPVAITPPTESIHDSHRPLTVRSLPHLPRFFRACRAADRRLREQRLEHVVQHVEETRRIRATHQRSMFIERKVQRLVAHFDSLRLLYPRDYLCMFESVALLEFLAHYDIYPDWVFGVTADPFQAHCWVQFGHVLLNDSLDHARMFSPIMLI